MRLIAVVMIWAAFSVLPASTADYVWVQNRHRLVDIEFFSCTGITSSTFLRRVCFDPANNYLLVELNETWLHYCGVDSSIVAAMLNAPAAARFYNSNIRSGPFDCKKKHMPKYDDE